MNKPETKELLEKLMVSECRRHVELMDVLGSAVDYVNSSHDKRAEMDKMFTDKMFKENKNV